MKGLSRKWLIGLIIAFYLTARIAASLSITSAVSLWFEWLFLMIPYLWYLSILKAIKVSVGLSRAQEILTIMGLSFVPLALMMGILKNISTIRINIAAPSTTLLVLVGIIVHIIAVAILSFNFKRLLDKNGIDCPFNQVLIETLIFPVAIWKYQDRVIKWN